MNLKIENYNELLGLHKTIMSSKFDPVPWIPEVQGSPFSSSIAFKVVKLIINWWENQGNKKEAEKWRKWQKANENRREYELLLSRIKNSSNWINLNKISRQEFVINFMAPFQLDSDLLEKTINIDKNFKQKES